MIERLRQSILRHRRRIAVIGVACCLGVVLVAAWFLARSAWRPIEVAAPTPITLEAASTVDAGAPWLVTIVDPPSGAAIEADVITVWGARRLPTSAAGTRTITVPGELTRRSGRLTVLVRSGSGVGTIAADVVPGEAVDGVTPLAGPRSIVADTEDWTMVTMFPRDRFGNSVVDGTPVAIFVRRPDGDVEQVTSEVQALYAAARVFSQTLAGRTALRVGAGSGRAVGQEVEVLEVPGPPTEVAIEPILLPLRADGRMLVTVRTGVLADQYDNVLLDGTLAVIRLDGPDGLGTLRATTIDGRVEFIVEAPAEPGELSVVVDVGGVVSEPARLDFLADVSALPVRVTRLVDAVRVDVGDVLTTLGGFVPDGTAVSVRTPAGTTAGTLRDGAATLTVNAAPGERLEIEVLGVITDVEAP